MDITAITISKYLYNVLNVSEITSFISGEVYRDQKEMDSELENIVINVNFLNTSREVGNQIGLANINILVKKLNGQHDLKRLEEISDLVITVLETVNRENISFYFLFQASMQPQTVLEQNTVSLLNLRYKLILNNY